MGEQKRKRQSLSQPKSTCWPEFRETIKKINLSSLVSMPFSDCPRVWIAD